MTTWTYLVDGILGQVQADGTAKDPVQARLELLVSLSSRTCFASLCLWLIQGLEL